MGGTGSGRWPKGSSRFASGEVVTGEEKLITRELIKQLLEDPEQQDPKRRTKAARIAANIMRYSLGDGPGCPPSIKAIAEVIDRTEGKAVQSSVVTVKKGSPEEQAARILEKLDQLAAMENLKDDGGTIQ